MFLFVPGQGTGGVLAGILYQYYGGANTWLMFGLFSLLSALVYAFGVIVLSKRRNKTPAVMSTDL